MVAEKVEKKVAEMAVVKADQRAVATVGWSVEKMAVLTVEKMVGQSVV